ncbi:Hypothetical protein A7982_11026 [Minicystis rosea]|nr:Hypothetical protein A7982_11026 [Minicystis rosea]
MCPACLLSIGLVVAKTASAGAVTALVVKKIRKPKTAAASNGKGDRQ